MAKPQVTLTLAGDASKLEQVFGDVGASSKKMADEVGSSSKRVADETTDGFDRAGEAADNVDTKAMGFRDTLTGVQDTMAGTAMIARGDLFNGFFTLGAGIGDLASGFFNFLIPAMKGFSKASIAAAADTVRQTAATAAHRGATIASAAATKVMTVAQRALNLAMRANPIGLVITAGFLLAGLFVLLWKRSSTFRSIVTGALNAVKTVAMGAFNWIRGNWPLLLAILTGPIGIAVLVIRKHRDSILGFFRAVPGAISRVMRGVADTITAPFRAAFNGIRSAWNSVLGGKGFSFPGIAGKGAFSFSIPFFHTGGVMPGAPGTQGLAMLQAGERVTPAGASGPTATIVFQSDGTRTGELLVRLIKESVRVRGGNAQFVLGSGS